jgi:hypothetical protein
MTVPGMGRAAVAAVVALAVSVAAPAPAAGIGKARAAAVAKRVASARVARYGLTYPPTAWRAACRRRAVGVWRCEVHTGGQCSGAVTVTGTVRPRVRDVDVWCFE